MTYGKQGGALWWSVLEQNEWWLKDMKVCEGKKEEIKLKKLK